MSTVWEDDMDADSADYDDSELYDDFEEDHDDLEWAEEDFDNEDLDEESRASRRRRARRIALARRRQAQARARARARGRATPSTRRPASRSARATSPARATSAAIRTVDLESKVAADGIRQELNAQRKRMSRSEYAAVAGLVVNQAVDTFGGPGINPYVRAGLKATPLLLLAPQKRGTGVGAVVTDPRFIGAAAVLGMTFLGERMKPPEPPDPRIEASALDSLHVTGTAFIAAHVVSPTGAVLGTQIDWDTSNPAVATVDGTGKVTAHAPGGVFIIAKVEGIPDKHIPLSVTANGQAPNGQAPNGRAPIDEVEAEEVLVE